MKQAAAGRRLGGPVAHCLRCPERLSVARVRRQHGPLALIAHLEESTLGRLAIRCLACERPVGQEHLHVGVSYAQVVRALVRVLFRRRGQVDRAVTQLHV